MSSVSELKYKINRYENLYNKVSQVANNLSSASSSLDGAYKKVANNYKIDGDATKVASRILQLEKNSTSSYNTIVNQVKPAINSKLKSLRKELQIALAEEQG